MLNFRTWIDAIIVPDANILLGLFRLPERERRRRLKALRLLRYQIWIPQQFWHEYQIRRNEMRSSISKEYRDALSKIQSHRDGFRNTLTLLHSRLDFVSDREIELDALCVEIKSAIHAHSKEHVNSIPFDEINDQVEELCVGRVGEPLPDTTMADIPTIWQWRLDRGLPPGLKDRNKPEPNRYGDVIGWLQTVRHAVDRGRPVVFVTDDLKSGDWVVAQHSDICTPHPELVHELKVAAGVDLYILTSSQFMRLADQHLIQPKIFALPRVDWMRSSVARLGGSVIASTLAETALGAGGIGMLSSVARIGTRDIITQSLRSIEGFTAGLSGGNGLTDPMIGLQAVMSPTESLARLNEVLGTTHASILSGSEMSSALAEATFGAGGNGLFGSVAGISARDIITQSLRSIEGFTAGLSGGTGLSDPMIGLQAAMSPTESLARLNMALGKAYSPLPGGSVIASTLAETALGAGGIGMLSSVARIGTRDSITQSLRSIGGITAGVGDGSLIGAMRTLNSFADLTPLGSVQKGRRLLVPLSTLQQGHLASSHKQLRRTNELLHQEQRLHFDSIMTEFRESLWSQMHQIANGFSESQRRQLPSTFMWYQEMQRRQADATLKVFKETLQSLADAVVEEYRETLRRQFDAVMEEYREAQRPDDIESILKECHVGQLRRFDAIMKEYRTAQQYLTRAIATEYHEAQRRMTEDTWKSLRP